MINADVADICEIRDILNALIDELCCMENMHVEKSNECPFSEECISESESTPISPVKIEDNSMLVSEAGNCTKTEYSSPYHASSIEPILKDRNETDALNEVKDGENDNYNENGRGEEESLNSSETNISKNPFDDKEVVCATRNPFGEPNKTTISPVVMKAQSKSFIIRSQPPSANAISHTISQQRYNTGVTNASQGPKSLPVAAAPSYPKSLFAARSNQNEIPPSSSSSSSSSMGSSVRRSSVSVAVSTPPSRTPLAFVAPRESTKDFSPAMLT